MNGCANTAFLLEHEDRTEHNLRTQRSKEEKCEEIYKSLPFEVGSELFSDAISSFSTKDPAYDIALLSSFEIARDSKSDADYAQVGKDFCIWMNYYCRHQARELSGMNDA